MAAQVAVRRHIDDRSLTEDNEGKPNAIEENEDSNHRKRPADLQMQQGRGRY